MITDQQPHSDNLERAVIGSLLIDPDAVIRVTSVGLQGVDFWNPANRRVYETVLRLWDKGVAIDPTTVGNALAQTHIDGADGLEYIGAWAGLTRYITSLPTTVHVADHAKQLKALAFRRDLLVLGTKIGAMGYNHAGTLEEVQQDAMQMVADNLRLDDTEGHLYGTDESLMDYLVTQQARAAELETDPDALITTPWDDLNTLLTDIGRGIVHVVAARPGTGKTIYLENVAEWIATRGKTVALYHLELSNQFMLDRRIARHSGVPYDRLRRGYSGLEISQAIDMIAGWQKNITFIHCPTWPVERIVADALRLNAEGKADVVMIDYLQKIPLPDERNRTEYSLMGDVIGKLKDAAERMKVPFLLACQIVRDMERRGENPVPRMSDLYGGTYIESFCNQIVILHRPQTADAPGKAGSADTLRELHVVKNTQGAIGKVTLVHEPGRFLFLNYADAQEPPQLRDRKMPLGGAPERTGRVRRGG